MLSLSLVSQQKVALYISEKEKDIADTCHTENFYDGFAPQQLYSNQHEFSMLKRGADIVAVIFDYPNPAVYVYIQMLCFGVQRGCLRFFFFFFITYENLEVNNTVI